MSDIFGITITSLDDISLVAQAIDQYLSDQYPDDNLVAGHIAITEDGHVGDVRVYVHGIPGNPINPHGDGAEAWADMVDWMSAIGSHHTFTFVRRPHDRPANGPSSSDEQLAGTCRDRCPDHGIVYHGHIITNGGETSYLAPVDPMAHSLGELLPNLDNAARATLGRSLLRNMIENYPDTDPVVLDAMQRIIDRYENDTVMTDEDVESIQRAMRLVENELSGLGTKPKSPFDVPDINERPDVPPAFYH